MKCPICGHEMLPLFTSYICEVCEARKKQFDKLREMSRRASEGFAAFSDGIKRASEAFKNFGRAAQKIKVNGVNTM